MEPILYIFHYCLQITLSGAKTITYSSTFSSKTPFKTPDEVNKVQDEIVSTMLQKMDIEKSDLRSRVFLSFNKIN